MRKDNLLWRICVDDKGGLGVGQGEKGRKYLIHTDHDSYKMAGIQLPKVLSRLLFSFLPGMKNY